MKRLLAATAALALGASTAMAQFLQPITLTASRTLTQSEVGAPLLMGAAGAALTFTLPAATGTGRSWTFIVSVVNTSNYLIKVANATDTIDGSVYISQDSADTVVQFTCAGTDDTLTINGTTTGGVTIGDTVVITDVAAGQFAVAAWMNGSGTEATPCSATVT